MNENLLTWLLVHYGQEEMRPGLSRMREALEDLFPNFTQTKIIIIAGTNGKGETTLRLSELLKGKLHAVWTSPHIERITERMRNERGEIPFIELQDLIYSCHEEVQERGWKLSFYEFLFLVFCTWASHQNLEYLLLEVGLGGRLDAVNVFDADMVLLPSVSRDHQEILGKRYDQILAEKLGTLREKTTLIHFLENSYLSERAAGLARSVGAKVLSLKDEISLPAYEFSKRNSLLAAAAFCFLTNREFLWEEWDETPKTLEHRGEVLKGKCEFVLFGSHNVDGLRKLIQFLSTATYNFQRPPYDAVIVAFSRRSHDDLRVMLRMLKNAKLGKVVVTVFEHPKAQKANEMEVLTCEEGLDFVRNVESFIKDFRPEQRVLVTGSYYFLGDFKKLLRSC